MRCGRRDISRKAPSGPSTTAALRIDQPAGERRHERLEALQPDGDEHEADQVLRRLVQPERPQHPIIPRHAPILP